MAEMGKPKKSRMGKGGEKSARKGVGVGKKLAGDTKARAQHGTQGGLMATPRKDSPRVPAGGRGGGSKAGR